MKYCTNCGSELKEGADVCLNCGKTVEKIGSTAPSGTDTGSFGWGLLGFCIPLVGLILYLMWKDEKPLNAKKAGRGAIFGFVLSIVGAILQVIMLSQMM